MNFKSLDEKKNYLRDQLNILFPWDPEKYLNERAKERKLKEQAKKVAETINSIPRLSYYIQELIEWPVELCEKCINTLIEIFELGLFDSGIVNIEFLGTLCLVEKDSEIKLKFKQDPLLEQELNSMLGMLKVLKK